MPSVKMPKKSTDTDMTPFVDIAFLILSFFIMATKFKPAEPVEITQPNSVSADELPENDAMMVLVDSSDRVFFSVLSDKDKSIFDKVLDKVAASRSMTFTPEQKQNFRKTVAVGVPFSQLPSFLNLDPEEQMKVKQPGIPVLDTLNNELIWWIGAVKSTYADMGRELKYLVKGDGKTKYPTVEAIINAFKKNDQLKFNFVTSLEGAPANSELDLYNRRRVSGGIN